MRYSLPSLAVVVVFVVTVLFAIRQVTCAADGV